MTTDNENAEKIFSGASDSRLPSNVSDLSLAKRRQWVGAWNGRFRDCQSEGGSSKDCESSAFAVANSAIKDMTEEEAEKFVYMEGFEVMDVQLGQDAANYNSIGGTDERACGNCQWFLTPNKCVVVKGFPDPINPNGLSDLWRQRVTEEEFVMPVRIVEEQTADASVPPYEPTKIGGLEFKVPKGLLEKAKNAVMNIIKGGHQEAIAPAKPLTIFKDEDGDLRWFAWAFICSSLGAALLTTWVPSPPPPSLPSLSSAGMSLVSTPRASRTACIFDVSASMVWVTSSPTLFTRYSRFAGLNPIVISFSITSMAVH